MKPDSPFLELEEGPRVRVLLDGAPLDLPERANLAAALLAAGGARSATRRSAAPRAGRSA